MFDEPPADLTSREVSVQEVLASLIAGRACAWFEPYAPTERGRAFLRTLWASAFGDTGETSWFVSEYPLPVPPEWRAEIPFTYRCPDFACGAEDRLLVVELKTERSSYQPQQMADYLRLVRHKLPDCATDVALLAPHRPRATPPHDERQRYAELTWADIPTILADAFGDDPRAQRLSTFLAADLAAPAVAMRDVPPAGPAAQELSHGDRVSAAVGHALRLAPSVATARAGDRTERGIDVAFESSAEARAAKPAISEALTAAGHADEISVWLWQPSSAGYPTTPSGHTTGRELRLAPKLKRS